MKDKKLVAYVGNGKFNNEGFKWKEVYEGTPEYAELIESVKNTPPSEKLGSKVTDEMIERLNRIKELQMKDL
ncbi:hypothetical protein BH09PAT1_BH09PAT1_6550 [soil metagenome]